MAESDRRGDSTIPWRFLRETLRQITVQKGRGLQRSCCSIRLLSMPAHEQSTAPKSDSTADLINGLKTNSYQNYPLERENRDRDSPRGLPPPAPPGKRVRTTAVLLVKLSWQEVPEATGRPVLPTPCRARRSSGLENGCCARRLCGSRRSARQDLSPRPTSAAL
jgi:hypothetical protein